MWCFGILVSYCVASTAPPAQAGATFCQISKPIYWSAQDSRKTKEQADRHNRKGKALCGWGPGK